MLTLTYEYKLIPDRRQIEVIENTLDVCRSVWNYALRERKDWLNSRKSPVNACSLKQEYIIPVDTPYPNCNNQSKALTEAKKTNDRLKSVNAQVLQQVLRTLDRAFADMQSKKMGFPRFKNKYRLRSYVYPQMLKDCVSASLNTGVKGNQIKLPQLGLVKFRKSRDIPNGFEVKQARIVRRASGYFVMLSLQLDVNIPDVPFHGHPLGIDLGLDKFLATSDGELVARPRFLNQLHRKLKLRLRSASTPSVVEVLKLLQRRLRNKIKGSNNRHKLNQKIARLHQRISDTRKDWHFKLAHSLCDQAQSIFIEDINFISWAKGMLRKHTLDASFGQFVTILNWVAWKRDVFVAKVDKNYTSQICPNCGFHTGKKLLSEREHNCPECGYRTHRDVAAAQVIRNRGVEEYALHQDALGHSVSENVCGDGLAGAAMPSQESVKQKLLNANLRIPRYIALSN
ncbi:transposase [Crocosphaera sp. XPORK-15E]|uniref:RNA-guided endonuclease InsQ/TnpB family protein n=1 Tax=Crocosphaera sp. XPORK-15E TaxID=3110247 RepID=UPI002B22027B|nr:transposase [Crocosphaera sp. XPORK-15E]MEA5533134.1 transposase [Crocosphaera sp. XPORK-15E]